MHKKFLLIIFSILTIECFSQDIHFSDFYFSPLNLNPSLAGLFRGKVRANLTYRDQYRTVAIPYQTLSFGVDLAKSNIMNTPNALGYGLQVNTDVAGDSHFSTYQIIVPLVLHHKTYSEKLTLSGGIGLSMIYNSIDFSGLTYPDQFDGDKYDEFLSNNENIESDAITYFNLSAGINGIIKPAERQTYSIGIALDNITKPNYSFNSDAESRLKRRLILHGLSRNRLSENIDIIPSIKIQFQGTQQEYQFGTIFYQYINNATISAINYGLWFRSKDKDAIVLNLGFNIANFQTSFSYDINVSSLSEASNGHGAFEISLLYIHNKLSHKRKFKSIKCPSYL